MIKIEPNLLLKKEVEIQPLILLCLISFISLTSCGQSGKIKNSNILNITKSYPTQCDKVDSCLRSVKIVYKDSSVFTKFYFPNNQGYSTEMYNSKQQLVKAVRYILNRDSSKQEYVYDDKGSKVESNLISYPSGGKTRSVTCMNKYDTNGRLIRQEESLNNELSAVRIITYDTAGYSKVEHEIFSPGKSDINKYSFYINGKIVRTETNGDTTSLFEYYDNGKMRSNDDGRGQISYYEYNEQNMVVKETTYKKLENGEKSSKPIMEYDYEFTFDAKNRWTKMIVYLQNSSGVHRQPIEVLYRTHNDN